MTPVTSPTSGAVRPLADSFPLFSLPTAERVQQELECSTPARTVPGLLVLHLDDTVGADVDPARDRLVVLVDATATPHSGCAAGRPAACPSRARLR